ncbi:hypothetical protein RIR_jg21938.t1 [Rhizophagus irregularis DAOM 181602=DAOM 197198]|nr:hypothetical protein RIR_jg21938.t1 [Rhizophagus irregularis DAOM 181602=DAOM 197198]
MENSNVQDYITLSENEESSDELTILELTSQISNNPNPFKLTTTMTKPQTKVSWYGNILLENKVKMEKYVHIVSLYQIMEKMYKKL